MIENNVVLIISILLFLSGITWMIYAIRKNELSIREIMSLMVVWMGLSLFPLYLIGNMGATGGILDALISSFLGVFRSVTGENSLSDTREALSGFPDALQGFIANYTAILHLICATFLIGLLLTLFKNVFAKMAYNFSHKKELYIFSEVSEYNINLAESIYKKDDGNGCMIIFLGKINEEENNVTYLERLKKIKAYVFNTSLINFKIKKQYHKYKVHMFLFKQNEEENLKDALELHDKYSKKIMENISSICEFNKEELKIVLEKKHLDYGEECLNLLNINSKEICIDIMLEYEKINNSILLKDLDGIENNKEIINRYNYNAVYKYLEQNYNPYKKLINIIKKIEKTDNDKLSDNLIFIRKQYNDLKKIEHKTNEINECFEITNRYYLDKFTQIMLHYHKYRTSDTGPCIEFLILSTKKEAVAITDAITYPININYRIVNQSISTVYKLFNEQPLFLGRQNNKLQILIIGGGSIGTMATKIASWMGQTTELMPEIVVVDNDELWERRFELECPELTVNNKTPLSEKETKISFYALDVHTSEFYTVLSKHKNIGYVICALGNDELNLNVAVKVREMMEKIYYDTNDKIVEPLNVKINVLFDNKHLYDVSKKLKFDNRVDCELIPFNVVDEVFTWDNMINPYLDNLGKAVNRAYELDYQIKEVELGIISESEVYNKADIKYNDKEYERNSSMASGMHLKNKLYSALVELKKENVEPTYWVGRNNESLILDCKKIIADEMIVEELSILEHRRWNAYMRSQGWTVTDFTTLEKNAEANKRKHTHRNYISKQSACLVSWDELDKIDEWLIKGWKDKTFKDLDRTLVKKLPQILRQAEDLLNKNK